MEELLLGFVAQRWSDTSSSAAPPTPRVHIRHTPDQGRTLVLADAVSPGQVVLSVPPNALLNLKTIRDVFPVSLLPRPAPLWTPLPEPPTLIPDDDQPDSTWGTAPHASPGTVDSSAVPGRLSHTGIVSFYLALCRQFPRERLPPRLAPFIAMIDSMPDSLFTTHPLWTYLYARGLCRTPSDLQTFYETLWSSFTPRVQILVKDVYRRFRNDWAAVCKAYEHVPTTNALRDKLFPDLPSPDCWRIPLPLITKEVFVWAWLCVNTRCIFYELQLSPRQDNFTLMPLIDMANHTNDAATAFEVHYTSRGGLELRAPSSTTAQKDGDHWRGLRQGDPVCLQYGPHANPFLFAEYGFALTKDGGGYNRYNDVVLDDTLNSLIDCMALESNDPIHPRTVLKEAGYSGDWTIQEQPLPAHPSWRTTMVMWCLSCYVSDRAQMQCNINKWHKAASGLVRSAGDAQGAGIILAAVIERARPSKTLSETLAKLRSFSKLPPDGQALIGLSATLLNEQEAIISSLLARLQGLIAKPDTDWHAFWDA